jgi:spermidine/putrescine-binding protein
MTQRRKTMNTKPKVSVLLIAGLAAAGMAVAQDQEKKIKRSDLPAAVEKTVAAESAGATIRGFSQEKENGKVFYEAEMTVSGYAKDVLIDANGAVVEVEEEVALDSLSPEIKAGLLAKADKGKITTVETIKKRNKLVAYEAKVSTNGKKSEVQVGPDGKPLDHEE